MTIFLVVASKLGCVPNSVEIMVSEVVVGALPIDDSGLWSRTSALSASSVAYWSSASSSKSSL